ncbi:hypothetical protein NQ317_002448 [Molorchus minor]|uniref:Odorant receptor n=1 Tax=Molorchus minor TaxID=1323400 RepID=A0ABQ9J8H7_9CUCU|nr:hypothetical protein NQ317_002448 [Molorchus minor]
MRLWRVSKSFQPGSYKSPKPADVIEYVLRCFAYVPTIYTQLISPQKMKNQVHMKFAKILMAILGIWPVKLSGYNLKLYNAYFYTSFAYYIVYAISQAAMVFISDGNFVQVASNLGVTIVYVINIYKILICRSQPIKKILLEIEIRETLILEGNDMKFKEIYQGHAKTAFKSLLFYISLGTVGVSLYFITPIVKNLVEDGQNLENNHKSLILSSWFPFDSDEHYLAAYLIQCVAGFYGYAYIVYVGAFFSCILRFIVGQIQILQHVFRNINHYIDKYSRENSVANRRSQVIFTKLCIREHQYLIDFVQRFDKSIKTFMLLEFIVSSFQLSLVVYQILQPIRGVKRDPTACARKKARLPARRRFKEASDARSV